MHDNRLSSTPLLLLLPPLLLLLHAACSAAALNISSGTLTINYAAGSGAPATVTLQLLLSNMPEGISATAIAALPWHRAALREAWLAPRPLQLAMVPVSVSLSGATATAIMALQPGVHHTTSRQVEAALYCLGSVLENTQCDTSEAATASSLPLAVVRVGTPPTESAFRDLRPPRTCRSFRNDASALVVLQSVDDLREFSRMECSVVAGTLQITGVTLTDAQWHATFLTLDNIEGGVILDNVANFGLRHLQYVRQLSSGRGVYPATERQLFDDGETLILADGVVALSVTDAVSFTTDGLLKELVDGVVQGRGVVRIRRTEPAICLTSADASGFWWAQPGLVEIVYDAANCSAACPLHLHPTTGDCVAACPGCGARCQGGVVSTRTDIQNLRGPANSTPCALIRDGLVMSELLDVTDIELQPLTSISHIEGFLYIARNAWLVTLAAALPNLQHVPLMALEDNPALMDARLPLLDAQVADSVVAVGNTLLCEAGMPGADILGPGCGPVMVEAVFAAPTLDPAALRDADVISQIQAKLLQRLAPLGGLSVNLNTDVAFTTAVVATAVVDPDAPRFTLCILVAQAQSYDLLAELAVLASEGTVQRDWAELPDVGLMLADAVLLWRPRLRPGPAAASDGFVVSATRNSDVLAASWTAPGSVGASSADYVIDTSMAASAATIEAIAAYLMSDNGFLSLPGANVTVAQIDAYEMAMAQAQLGARRLFVYDSRAVANTVGRQATLEACTRVQGGVLVQLPPTSGCFVAGRRYKLRLRAFVHGDAILSNEVEFTLADDALSIPDVAVSTSAEALNISWTPVAAAMVFSYEVRVRYADAYNELSAGAVLPNELFDNVTHQRLQLPRTASSVQLSGCFYDAQRGTSHCLSPFTAYRVAVRAIGADGPGLLHATLAWTKPVPCSQPPRLVAQTTPTANSLASELRLQRPVTTTSVVAGFVLRWTGSQGSFQSGEKQVLVPEPRLQQSLAPDQIFAVVLDTLHPYTLYSVEVATMTEDGELGAALEFQIETPQVVPSQPDPPIVEVLPTNTSLVRIRWSEPEPLPDDIASYEIRANFISHTQPGVLLYNGTGLSLVMEAAEVGSSENGAPPSIYLRIHTSLGSSPWSMSSLAGSGSGRTNTAAAILQRPDVLAGMVAFVVLVGLLIVVRRVRKRSQDYKAAEEASVLTTPQLERWEMPRQGVTLGRKLGQGAFGEVYQARAVGLPGHAPAAGPLCVAVKMCTRHELSDKADFMKEAMVMQRFADPHHENVLRLLGVVMCDEPLMIITEFMARGDLRSFLRNMQPTPEKETLSLSELVYIASDIASGMAFLAAQKFVHRDLACRNCLVGEDMTVKVADFGLSRNLDYTEYYRKTGQALLPIRWMDPLALTECKFSTATDVWSFGIVLYEIFTFGRIPYAELSNIEVFEKVVNGHRMAQPKGCPDEIFAIMWSCWRSGNRPSFAELDSSLMDLGSMFEKMERQSRVNSDALASRLEGALSPGWRRPISPHRKLEPAAAYDMPEDALSPDMLRQIVLQGLASRLEDTSELVTSRKSNSKKLMQPPKPAQDAGGKSEVNTVVAKTTVIEMDGYCDMSDAHTPIVATTALGKAPGETEQLEWDSSDLVPECSQVVSQKNTRAVMPYAPSKSTSPRLLKRAPPPPPTTRLRPLPPTGNNSYLPIMGMPSTENATAADGYMPMGGGRLHMAQPPPPTMSVSLMAKPRNVVPTPPKQQLHLRAARDDKQGAMWA